MKIETTSEIIAKFAANSVYNVLSETSDIILSKKQMLIIKEALVYIKDIVTGIQFSKSEKSII
jgi:hypothetical protein